MLDDVARRKRHSNHRFLTPEEEASLIAAWKNGDASAGNDLALAFAPFINGQTAKLYAKYPYLEKDDVRGAVHMGFARALEKFEPERGNRFSSYAAWWIKAFIQDEAQQGSKVRAAARTQQARVTLACIKKEIGTTDSPLHEIYERVAKDQNMDTKRVRKIHETAVVIISGESASANKDGGEMLSLFDRLEDDTPQGAEITERNSMTKVLRTVMGALPAREKYVLAARFGLFKNNEGEERTLEDIADVLKLSKERVRQIEVRALQILRREFKDLGFDMDDLILPSGKVGYIPPKKHRRSAPETHAPAP